MVRGLTALHPGSLAHPFLNLPVANWSVMRESDLRSLDRQRMYTIFAPLDANESCRGS